MTAHAVRLLSRERVAERTVAFHFEKPSGFTFKPGQAIDVILAGQGLPTDTQDAKHTFSLVSAPYEDELVVATRLRDSAFKRTLGALPPGVPCSVDGPFGSLTLHKKQERAAVMIAGGIGVTPFMSILRQAAKDRLQQDLRLIYSNRRPEDAPFLTELQRLAQANPRFHLIATMTDMARSAHAWAGRTQRVDGALVKLVVENLAEPVFYLAGPPAMVQAMRQTLDAAGVDEDAVRSEEFYGY